MSFKTQREVREMDKKVEKFTREQVVAVRKMVTALSRNQHSATLKLKEFKPETLSDATLRRAARMGMTNIIGARRRELTRLFNALGETNVPELVHNLHSDLFMAIKKLEDIRNRI